jgi:addiction module HigA family antidote
MSIKREDIDNRKVDFSDITSGRRLPPVHPGEILRDEFLTPMEISVYELARAIKVPRTRVNDIVLGRRSITIDTAIRLGRYFGTSSEFWINLQTRYDLDVADRTVRRRIEREISPRVA